MDLVPGKYEIAALKECAGEDQDTFTSWGAALGASIEWLKNQGYVSLQRSEIGYAYKPTEKGINFLNSL